MRLWYKRKESNWRQLGRENLIKFKDRNTRYFHALALGKRRKKCIHRLRITGRLVEGPRIIKREARKFFKEL